MSRSMLRFDVYGTLIGVERVADQWRAFYLIGPMKRPRPAADLPISPHLTEDQLAGHLADFCHHWMSEAHPEVRRLSH